MTLKIPHVDQLANGVLRFRRRFPKDVAEYLCQPTLQVHISNREGIAFQREYQAIVQKFEQIVSETRAKREGRDTRSPVTRWHEALLKAEGLVAETTGLELADEVTEHECDETLARHEIAKGLARFPDTDPFLLRALTHPNEEPPEPTLRDAVEKYRVIKRLNKADSVRLDRTASRLEEALGDLNKIDLLELRRDHGNRFLDHLLSRKTDSGKPMAIGSVRREINIARAVVNKSALELDVDGIKNPFEKLEIPKSTVAAVDVKLPLSAAHMAAMSARLEGGRSDDLRLAWVLLAGTGARLGEVAGLTIADIELATDTPCIHIRPNGVRGLKTTSSVRSVPLVGEALEAAQKLVARADASGTSPAFPRYAKERGADNLSAALMKHLRKVTTDKRFSVHGLRHAMQDKLRLAGAPSEVYQAILGHSHSGIAESTYGSAQARLKVQAEWMEKALGV